MSARSPSPVRACAFRRPSRLDLTVPTRMLSSDPCSRSFSNCSAFASAAAAAAADASGLGEACRGGAGGGLRAGSRTLANDAPGNA